MEIRDFFQKGYYINLDRRPDRNQLFIDEMTKVGLIDFLERVPAEDGINEPDAMKRHGYCGLTYKKLFQKAYEEGYERIIVFEDDACFYNEWDKPGMDMVRDALDELQDFPNWDIIFFGGCPLDYIEVVSKTLSKPRVVLGTHAVGYTRKVIEAVAKHYTPFNDAPVDAWYGGIRNTEKFLVNPFALFQRSVTSDLDAHGHIASANDYLGCYSRVKKINKMRKTGTFLTRNYITCQLVGRTGNMMFEIAHAYAKSLEYNRQLVVPLAESSHNHLRNTLFRKIDFSIRHSTDDIFARAVHAPFTYVDLKPEEDTPTIFCGYYQSEKYFGKYAENIKDLFSPPLDFITRAIADFPFLRSSVVGAINVRRGDYLSMSTRHPVVTIDYINEAYKHLPKCDHILVLSDDIEWCKQNIKLPNVIFVDKYWDCEGLWLLSLCDHFIISNSTFSWWGAYLSRSDNKVVIAPETWFGPHVNEDPKDIYCEGWVKVPTYYEDGWIKVKKKHKIVSVYQSDLNKDVVEYQKKVFDHFGIPLEQVSFESGGEKVNNHPKAMLNYINSLTDWDSITFFDIDCVPTSKDCIERALQHISDDNTLYGNAQASNVFDYEPVKTPPFVAPSFMSFTKKFWDSLTYKSFVEGMYPNPEGAVVNADVAEIFSRECEKQGKRLIYSYPTNCIGGALWKYDGSFGGQAFGYGIGTEFESGTYHNYQIRIGERQQTFIDYCKKLIGEV